jgi:hypothetical protein
MVYTMEQQQVQVPTSSVFRGIYHGVYHSLMVYAMVYTHFFGIYHGIYIFQCLFLGC